MFNFAEELRPASPRYLLKLVAVSVLIVFFLVLAYVLLNPEPPVPEGELYGVRLYTPDTPSPVAENTAAAGLAPQPSRSLLVLAPVKLHNVSNKAFAISGLSATVDMGSDQYQSTSVPDKDFPRVFHSYPELSVYQQPPLLHNTVLHPGETRSGLVVFNYPLTPEQWERRTSFQVDVTFDHGKDVVLTEADPPLLSAEVH
jgi:hypothetical protein